MLQHDPFCIVIVIIFTRLQAFQRLGKDTSENIQILQCSVAVFGGLIYGLCMSWLVLVHVNEQVKLDPSMVDAWCCLGNCFWKKGDLVQAKNCFNIALSKVSILFPIFVF